MSTFERTGFSDQLNIDTPEQVELSFHVAGLGSRFVAVLIDALLLAAAYFAVGLIMFVVLLAAGLNKRLDLLGSWMIAVIVIILFLLLWGYFALFEALWRGQTIGKRVMKLRVVKDSGRQITFFESLARNLLRYVDFLPFFFLTGVITMLCNKRNKRLGDFVAGTLVVHESAEEQPLLFQSGMNIRPVASPNGDAEPWREQTAAMFPADAIAKLDGQDLLLIETFFARMLDLALETRAAIAYRIAGQMAAKMGYPLPEGNPERALESMAHQMRSSGRRF
jgi:uncharacterized RDD family membrane protein YckC